MGSHYLVAALNAIRIVVGTSAALALPAPSALLGDTVGAAALPQSVLSAPLKQPTPPTPEPQHGFGPRARPWRNQSHEQPNACPATGNFQA